MAIDINWSLENNLSLTSNYVEDFETVASSAKLIKEISAKSLVVLEDISCF